VRNEHISQLAERSETLASEELFNAGIIESVDLSDPGTTFDLEINNLEDPLFKDDLRTACQRAFGRFRQSTHPSWEDLKQEVLLKFGRWLPKYQGNAKRKAVFYRIAVNVLIDARREEMGKRRYHNETKLNDLEWESLRDMSTPSIENQTIFTEFLAQLSQKEQELFRETIIQGESLRGIAKRRQVPALTISKEYTRLVERIAALLGVDSPNKSLPESVPAIKIEHPNEPVGAPDVSDLLRFVITVRNGELAA
jgi:RNA polymerase sigma factor (sigma-70 family)